MGGAVFLRLFIRVLPAGWTEWRETAVSANVLFSAKPDAPAN